MPNMSFFLTEKQFLAREKDVTRRYLSWRKMKKGDYFTAVRKQQGLRKGEHTVVLGQCQCVNIHTEPLHDIIKRPVRVDQIHKPDTDWKTEVQREGFPDLSPEQFVQMLCKEAHCHPHSPVQRIVFKRLD